MAVVGITVPPDSKDNYEKIKELIKEKADSVSRWWNDMIKNCTMIPSTAGVEVESRLITQADVIQRAMELASLEKKIRNELAEAQERANRQKQSVIDAFASLESVCTHKYADGSSAFGHYYCLICHACGE